MLHIDFLIGADEDASLVNRNAVPFLTLLINIELVNLFARVMIIPI